MRQLVRAGVPLPGIRHIFITHHHSDHNADYGNLLLLAWIAGLQTPVDAWGPPPLEKMTQLFLEMNAYDIGVRVTDERRAPLAPLIQVHEQSTSGVVLQDETMKVTIVSTRQTAQSSSPGTPRHPTTWWTWLRGPTSWSTRPSRDVGRVAQAAGVKTLVLSHLVPAEDPSITDQMWIDAARMHFRGRIILGKDLMDI